MRPLTYPACIRKLYESEVNGERIYSALLKAAKTERERFHLATLLQLESETRARLQPFLFRHRVEFSAPDIQPFVDQAVALYESRGWRGLMEGSRPVVLQGISTFQAIAELGPAQDAPVLASMVRHEQAILHWIDAELAGNTQDSLRAVVAELAHPVEAPAGE